MKQGISPAFDNISFGGPRPKSKELPVLDPVRPLTDLLSVVFVGAKPSHPSVGSSRPASVAARSTGLKLTGGGRRFVCIS